MNGENIFVMIGGYQFVRSVGATDINSTPVGLNFKMPVKLTKNKATHCDIRVTDDSTFTITFLKLRQSLVSTVSQHENVELCDIKKLLETETGFLFPQEY